MKVSSLVVVGNVGSVQEVKPVGDTFVLNFTLAANRYKGKNEAGEHQNETSWFKVVYWGERAVSIAPYIHKGGVVAVEGDLAAQPDVWISQDGEARGQYVLNAQYIDAFIGGSNREQGHASTESRNSSVATAKTNEYDEIPF